MILEVIKRIQYRVVHLIIRCNRNCGRRALDKYRYWAGLAKDVLLFVIAIYLIATGEIKTLFHVLLGF